MKTALSLLMALFAFATTASAASTKPYETTLEDIQVGTRILSLVFYTSPPSPKIVDQILYQSLQQAVSVNPSRDILAMGFVGDDAMTPNQYSGELIYRASQKKIMSFDEYRGLKTSGEDRARYYLSVTEEKTAAGITPERKWLSLSLIYPTRPRRNVAYEDLLAEIKELSVRGLDIDAFVFVGDKNVKTSWHQVKDSDGAYLFCSYDAHSRKITRKETVLSLVN